uniref:Envelope protein n=1 Tax=Neogobius melanostomus TaxID=47308 RepID=A0A8C6WTQ3_9GOBI
MSPASILCLLLNILVAAVAKPATKAQDDRTNDVNIFLTMAWQVANHIGPNNSSCYICGLMPYTAGEGLPLMALPASDCDTCHLLHVHAPKSYSHPDCPKMPKMRPLNCSAAYTNCNRCVEAPKPVPIQLIPRPFRWCLGNDGKTVVGESDCVRTFKWDPKLISGDIHALNAAPDQCLELAGEEHLNILAHRTATCSISAPVGMYWVCGGLAYPYLPIDYKGCCGLAYVVPAMRVAHKLPEELKAKRVRRGTSDIFGTHHQSSVKNVLGPLLPFYGVMSALDQISDLSHAIETIANETGRALQLMSSELASVRLLALQNRAALDFLLAAQGGTCAIIGQECCTFVPDYNATINDIVTHLYRTGESVQQVKTESLFDWLTPTFGAFTHRFVESVIILVVAIVLLSLFVSCAKKFLCKIS